ncbi:PH domain-containing protein [Ornithinicoccus hortensis]|uniref:PH domain-containing protein n=1 Tax=Ornithinicoccus hortensis TaxID=82346 RepID=UPI001296B8F7
MARTDAWHQLNPKMLLVTPVRTLISLAAPILVALFGIGRGVGSDWAARGALIAAVAALIFGMIPWVTTKYRFTDTQLQVHRGLISRNVLTAPLDRVRSVDLESSLLHRLLGLTKVKVGTGVDDTQIELDALGKEEAAQLRRYLLGRSEVVGQGTAGARGTGAAGAGVAGTAAGEAAGGAGSHDPTTGVPDGAADLDGDEQELARIDWSWLRFAPFSLSSLAIVAAIFGVGSQFIDDIDVDLSAVEGAWEWVAAQALIVVVGSLTLVLLIAWIALSTLNYVVQWWNLRVVRERRGTLRVTRGLLTTNATTVEEARIRGVRMTEALLLRMVRGAELFTLATGVGSGGTSKILPPSPRAVDQQVGHTVLEEDGALTKRLRRHGPRSRMRQFVQAQWNTVIVLALAITAAVFLSWPWWVPALVGLGFALIGLWIGFEEYRNLGHGLTPRYLVGQQGSLLRQRHVLERDGIIGWNVRQSFFQRRRGLATLVATTAAGPESVEIRDLPLTMAVDLADSATPGLLRQFAVGAPSQSVVSGAGVVAGSVPPAGESTPPAADPDGWSER